MNFVSHAQEVKWVEREIYTVRDDVKKPQLVKVRITSPQSADAGGFYLDGTAPESALHMLVSQSSRGDSWDLMKVPVAAELLGAGLKESDPSLKNLRCVSDPLHGGTPPLYQLGHQVIMMLGVDAAFSFALDPSGRFPGIKLINCAPDARDGRLPVMFTLPAGNNQITEHIGFLTMATGEIESIAPVEEEGTIEWTSETFSVIAQTRYTTKWMNISSSGKHPAAEVSISGRPRWILFHGKLRAWLRGDHVIMLPGQ